MKIRRLVRRESLRDGVARWNDTYPTVPLTDRLAVQNVYSPAPAVRASGWYATDGDELVGIAVAKRLAHPVPGYDEGNAGWLSLFAVEPSRLEAVGVELLDHALADLGDHGVERITFGSDIQKFVPGLPAETNGDVLPVLTAAGFEETGTLWDLHCDLGTAETAERIERHLDAPTAVSARPARPEDEPALREFVEREFPGRWAYQVETICRLPGGIDDYWLAVRDGTVVGFARTGTADSVVLSSCTNWVGRWGDRYGGLGPIGVVEDARGDGIGSFLIASIMDAFLRDGRRHMTIDGVAPSLLDFYATLGFAPEIEFRALLNQRK